MPVNNMRYLHDLAEFSELIEIVANERGIIPQLVEKDYWIMHCLYGLTSLGFFFELKGGTSFRNGDNLTITENDAFLIADSEVRRSYELAFQKKPSLYYGSQPSFETIFQKIQDNIHHL